MITAEQKHLRNCSGWLSWSTTRRQKECPVCSFVLTDAAMLAWPTCVECGVTVSRDKQDCDCDKEKL